MPLILQVSYAIELFQMSCVPVQDNGIEILTLLCHITIYKHDGKEGNPWLRF